MLRKQPKKARKTARLRCPGHLKFVRSFECLVLACTVVPVQAAHWRLGAHAGTGQKPDDTRAIPLCWFHHAESHRIGEERFAAIWGLDIEKAIAELCRTSPALQRLKAKGTAA